VLKKDIHDAESVATTELQQIPSVLVHKLFKLRVISLDFFFSV